MSFVFGLSLGNTAILLADTQLNFKFKDGTTTTDGCAPFTFSLDGVGEIRWTNSFRKLVQLPIGYAAGAGDAVLSRKILDRLGECSSISIERARILIAELANEIRTPVLRHLPEAVDCYDKTLTILLIPDGDRVTLTTISSAGEVHNTGQEYCVFWPPDLDKKQISAYVESLCDLTVPEALPDLYKNVAVLAKLASSVSNCSSTVGDQIELGLCVVDKGNAYQGYVSGISSIIASMSIQEISKQVNQRPVVQC